MLDDGRSADTISDKDLIDRLKNNDPQFKHHLVRSTADQILERAKCWIQVASVPLNLIQHHGLWTLFFIDCESVASGDRTLIHPKDYNKELRRGIHHLDQTRVFVPTFEPTRFPITEGRLPGPRCPDTRRYQTQRTKPARRAGTSSNSLGTRSSWAHAGRQGGLCQGRRALEGRKHWRRRALHGAARIQWIRHWPATRTSGKQVSQSLEGYLLRTG